MSSECILIVEDDAVVIRVLESQFRAAGYKVVAATTGAEAIRATVREQPDLMILDLTLIDGVTVNGLRDGLGVLQWLRLTLPEAKFPVIVHTADTSEDLDERVRAFGVTAVFRKGKATRDLVDTVRKALDARKANPQAA